MNAQRIVAPIGAALLVCLAGAPHGTLPNTSPALAEAVASTPFEISWFTIDGGSGSTAGGTHTTIGTIGQPDVGRMSGGSFFLSGGFWSGGDVVTAVVDGDGEGDVQSGAPSRSFRVLPPSPNPVRSEMLLVFDMPETRTVRAGVYDVSGRLVRVLADEIVSAGSNQRVWDLRDQHGDRVSAGIYFLRLEAGPHQSRQKVVVVP